MNIMLVIVLIAFVLKMIGGYKKGAVKEVISVISLIVLCAILALIAFGFRSYMGGIFLGVAGALTLLIILLIVHRLVNILVAPVKLLSKLPIIHSVDKLLGVIFGGGEVLFILWTLFTLIMIFEMGVIEEVVLEQTAGSAFLTWIYQNNYLAGWLENIVGNFANGL